MNNSNRHQDIEQIKAIINALSQRYQGRGGDVQFSGVEGAVVRIAPAGFCWR